MKTFTRIKSNMLKAWIVTAQLLMPVLASAAVFTATSSGSWSSSATWAGGVAPGSDISLDQVIIESGVTVTSSSDITMNGALSSLQVDGTLDATANTVAVVNGSVTGAGSIIVNQISVGAAAALTFAGSINAQTFVNNGAAVALAAATTVESQLQLNGGAIVVGSAGLGLESGTQIVVNGGTLSLSGGLFTATESYTVLYQGGAATIGIEASGSGLSGVEVDLGSAGAEVSLDGDLSFEGDLVITQGTVVVGSNTLAVDGIIDVTANGSLDVSSSSSINVSTDGAGMIDLSFSSSPATIGSLSISAGSNATAELNGDLIVTTEFDVASGTFSLNGNALSVSGDFNGNGEFEATAGSDISISGNGSIQGGLMFAAGAQNFGDVSIDLTNGQSIAFGGNSTIAGSFDFQNGTIELQSGSSLLLDGSASIGAGAMFDGNADADITVSTSSSVAGDITFSNGSATIGNFTIDIDGGGSVSLGSDLGVEGDLSLTGGSLVVGDNSLMINGDIASGGSGSISVSSSSDIEINADGDLSGSLNFSSGSSTMGDLVINIGNDGSVMLGSDAGVSGTLDLQNGFIVAGVSDLMVSGTVTGGSADSYVVTWGQGSLMLDMTAGADAFFPVGTAVNYAPATLLQAGGSADGMFGISVANDVYANGTAGGSGNVDMSTWGDMVDHTWHITSELASNIDLTMTLEWEASAEANAFANSSAYISHYVNAAWDVSAAASATANAEGRFELTRAGITSLSPFAVFDETEMVGIDEPSQSLEVSFYPNPANDILMYSLTGQDGNATLEVFDANGRLISTKVESNNKGILDLSAYPPGVYAVKVKDESMVLSSWVVRQ